MANHDSRSSSRRRQIPNTIKIFTAEKEMLEQCPYWVKTAGGICPSTSSSTKAVFSELQTYWLISKGVMVWSEERGAYIANLSIVDFTPTLILGQGRGS